ncbi:MAG: SRPBCC domain-containing protein [Candidatus Omnitrophica bacterium]|nr:SRPBCC domain-containing protein [Candidatus Omnitrophota bacterium]
MFTICHQVGIKTDPQNVFTALATAAGVSSWWSRAEGDFEAGGEIKLFFGTTVLTLQILQQNPAKIAWQCVEVDPQWQDTQIIFEIEEKAGQTFVHFRHEMWSEESELFAHCSTKWAVFLLSLKSLLETGTGNPYPEDIPVRFNP